MLKGEVVFKCGEDLIVRPFAGQTVLEGQPEVVLLTADLPDDLANARSSQVGRAGPQRKSVTLLIVLLIAAALLSRWSS